MLFSIHVFRFLWFFTSIPVILPSTSLVDYADNILTLLSFFFFTSLFSFILEFRNLFLSVSSVFFSCSLCLCCFFPLFVFILFSDCPYQNLLSLLFSFFITLLPYFSFLITLIIILCYIFHLFRVHFLIPLRYLICSWFCFL